MLGVAASWQARRARVDTHSRTYTTTTTPFRPVSLCARGEGIGWTNNNNNDINDINEQIQVANRRNLACCAFSRQKSPSYQHPNIYLPLSASQRARKQRNFFSKPLLAVVCGSPTRETTIINHRLLVRSFVRFSLSYTPVGTKIVDPCRTT